MNKCAKCGKDISHLIDWDTISYGPEFCSVKCAEEHKQPPYNKATIMFNHTFTNPTKLNLTLDEVINIADQHNVKIKTFYNAPADFRCSISYSTTDSIHAAEFEAHLRSAVRLGDLPIQACNIKCRNIQEACRLYAMLENVFHQCVDQGGQHIEIRFTWPSTYLIESSVQEAARQLDIEVKTSFSKVE